MSTWYRMHTYIQLVPLQRILYIYNEIDNMNELQRSRIPRNNLPMKKATCLKWIAT